jgi:hypothetical protein
VTNCHDVDLIAERLALHKNDVEATIVSLLGEMQLGDSEEEITGKQMVNASRKSCATNKKDKKKLKKERQMERQRLKVVEERKGCCSVEAAGSGSEVTTTVDTSVLSSMEVKSI